MAENLSFNLKVDNNDLSKALNDGSKKAEILGNSLSTALGVFSGGLALKGFQLLGDAISGSVDFAKVSIKAYSEQEDALNKLGQALKASGSFSSGAVSDFEAFASEMQKTSKFGDELVLSQIAVAKSFGATNAKSKELVQAAANLAATFGGSLEDNLKQLGKTLSGEVGRLGQLIPELKGFTKAQLEAGAAADVINSRFGGAAASELDTYSGSVIKAANAFSDMQEEIGGLIVKTFDLSGANGGLAFVYEQITTAIQDYNIASSRSNGTLTESDRSVQQLKDKLNSLKIEYIDLEQQTLKVGFGKAATQNAQVVLNRLNREIEATNNQIAISNKQAEESKAAAAVSEKANPVDRRTAQEIASQQKVNNEILALQNQLELDKQNISTQFDNLKIQDEQLRNASEIERIREFEIQKALAKAEIDSINAQSALDGEDKRLELLKVAAEKELAISRANGNAKIALQTATNASITKSIQTQLALEKTLQEQKSQIIASSFGFASAVAKDGSKEQFIIQKAAALAQIAIARGTAIGMIPAQTAFIPYPANIAASAQLLANANIQAALGAATVAATTIKGFADGGIVGGKLNGATAGGDNRIATVRDGEMILNSFQQKNLFDAINSGTLGGGGDIVIQVDGRTIARAVRDQVKKGFVLT